MYVNIYQKFVGLFKFKGNEKKRKLINFITFFLTSVQANYIQQIKRQTGEYIFNQHDKQNVITFDFSK